MSLVLDLIFPKSCYQCHRSGDYLCLPCQDKLVYKSIKYSPNSRFDGRLSLFRYHQAIKDIITDLKFNFVSDLVDLLGLISVQGLRSHYPKLLDYWQTSGYVLVSIPLHYHRQNWRGFNQSDLLARQIATSLNLPYLDNLIIKTRNTSPQTSIKNKTDRRQNVSASYKLNSKIQPVPKNIILFDDVYTTGSTLKSAALCLPKDIHLWALTIAG